MSSCSRKRSRFDRYGLRLHPDKTHLVRFEQPGRKAGPEKVQPHEEPRSFDFLGFTHFWEKSRRGKWVVKRKTASDRITRFLRKLNLCGVKGIGTRLWHGNRHNSAASCAGTSGITGSPATRSRYAVCTTGL